MKILYEFRDKFLTGDVLTRLLLINCAMFVMVLLAHVLFTLITMSSNVTVAGIFQFPASPFRLALRPWTLITSMFTSYGLWHFLFNMLVLYWMGGIFQQYYTNSHLRGLYILGALAGMAFYMATYQTISVAADRDWADAMPMTSCAVLAFSTAVAFKAPNHQEQIPLIGNVKVKYIVIAIALVDAALLPHINPATDAAHAGAVLAGWLFCRMLSKGHDLTKPVTAFFVWLYGLKRRQ